MSDHRAKWTWEDGLQGEDGEWIERPALVLTRGMTKRRLRRHSLASSTGSSSATGGTPTRSKAQFAPGSSSFAHLPEESKTDETRVVTLEDVKAVAVRHISSALVQKMKTSTTVTFDELYRTEAMNTFLWAVLLYYNAFAAHNEASKDENIITPGTMGKEARETLRTAQKQLTQARVNLGQRYSELVTGQSHKQLHHTCQGLLRASKSNTDQHLYEVLYEFAMFVTWITFGYKDWTSIHKELGRLFKTQSFNRDIRVKGEATVNYVQEMGRKMDQRSDEYLSYRVYYNRPPQGNLRELHSPALVSYFPSPRERHAWAFEPPYLPKQQKTSLLPTSEGPPEKLGVIGELMSNVNSDTLKYKEEEEEEEEEEGEGEEEEEEEGEGGEGEEGGENDI